MGYMSSAQRDGIRRAIAAREQGRSKVRSTTTAVTMASVVTAGALALALPGSTHKTSTSSVLDVDRLVLNGFQLDEFRIIELEFRTPQAPVHTSSGSSSSNSSNSSNSSSSGLSSGSSPTSSSGSSQATSGGS